MIVLDTHIWIWYIDSPDILSPNALQAIEKAKQNDSVYISSISSWEIYMLEKKGRLKFKIPASLWIKKCERQSFFRFVPVDNDIARLAVDLNELLHSDPADCIIIATARSLGAPLVTQDEKILSYDNLETIR